ncbi:hypothetical protein ACFWPU_01065 [Streptomyces sp. NPDC058471]|uniref:hypothetical protein n=1 Tax=Streptomyces sp. NPDC058471 TaxID=3346516 RepID=UPI0036567B2B
MESLEDAIATGDRRVSLEAIRKYLAHELEGNRCRQCAMSQLRTGDTAALVLRLMKVMEEIEALPHDNGVVSELDVLRQRKSARTPNASDSAPPPQRGISGQGSS